MGGGGEFVDAVWEVNNLLRVDPTPAGQAGSTPLFRDPRSNTPLQYGVVNDLIKRLMSAVGEDPAGFSTHVLRIGGATALFAAGAVRACFEQCCSWTRRAGSTSASAVAGTEFDEVDDY